ENADMFFGRDADIQRLIEKLKSSRFLAVLGASGSGKSSLVRAGLVPALRAGELTGSGQWSIFTIKPGPRPIEALALCMAQLAGDSDQLGAVRRLQDHFRADQQALHLASQLAARSHDADWRTVVVVDQFEEIFTLCGSEDERRQFVALLLYAARAPEGPTVVV